MRRFVLAILLSLCASTVSFGQGARSPTETAVAQEPGYATGHVTCSDTQRPGRIAQVRLVPVPAGSSGHPDSASPKVKMPEVQNTPEIGEGVNPVETDMEGHFTIRNLKPGRYFVRVDLEGYVSPLLMFSSKDLQQPDEATRERIAHELQVLDIRPQTETRVEVSLQRGAAIEGTVRYDDGTPAGGINVNLLRQSAQGKWEGTHLRGLAFGSTDGRGHYLFESLPPGTYAVEADLGLREYSQATMPMPTNGTEMHVTMTKTTFELPVYSGSVLRKRDANPIKVEAAGNYDGNDIALPISKLHRVSGAVLAADGHALNSGKVILRYADDSSEVASVEVNRTDRQFHFPYVPEGSYTLAIEEARDVTEVEVPNAPGVTPKFRLEDKTLRQYGKQEQPLVVESDVEGVLATVPEPSRETARPPGGQTTQ